MACVVLWYTGCDKSCTAVVEVCKSEAVGSGVGLKGAVQCSGAGGAGARGLCLLTTGVGNVGAGAGAGGWRRPRDNKCARRQAAAQGFVSLRLVETLETIVSACATLL